MKTTQISSTTLLSAVFAVTMLFCSSAAFAQIKAGDNPTTINAGSVLELESTNKGLLMPRISLTTTTTWGLAGTAVPGMHVYNTNTGITSSNANYPTLMSKTGLYYWDGTGWVALAPVQKSTSITSFPQTTPGIVLSIPNGGAGGGSFCPFPALGSSPPPACATDLNRNASFTTENATNDVIFDFTGLYSVANNNTQIQFFILLYVDKTTPGVFELVDSYFITNAGVSCSGGYMNYKTTLKNLPPRNYNVKSYQLNWYNPGSPATIGIGNYAVTPTCGQQDFPNQKLTVSVSE